jgi:hypothetical protein
VGAGGDVRKRQQDVRPHAGLPTGPGVQTVASMRLLRALVVLVALVGCRKGADAPAVVSPSHVADGGSPSTPPPAPDAGAVDAGTPPDAGPVDAGPDAHRIGGLGLGPFPADPLTIYGSAQGLLEAPISASVDEGENLWVVTERALYLLAPGGKLFRRYTAQDGLHYGPGYTEPPDITLVEGGSKGECFVGYFARDTNSSMFKDAHMWTDPWAHLGKMDQVLLQPDGSLKVNRYDLRNSNDGHYYETRTIMSMVYDHFQHPGNLYVGSNHGVTRIVPAKYYPPPHLDVDPFNTFDERQWYADHVHPWVCIGGPCDGARVSTFGDWFGLTLAPDGRLWMGGLTNAGAIGFKDKLEDWVQSWQPVNPFVPAFEWPPVYLPARMGDPVNIRGVAVTHDGMAWFVSGGAEGWRSPHYGIAAWDGKRFTYFDPIALGAVEDNVLEVQALDDGRLLFGFAGSGLMVWEPGEKKARRITQRDGLPGERIGRIAQDRMHDPPLLLVPTDGGLALFRSLP